MMQKELNIYIKMEFFIEILKLIISQLFHFMTKKMKVNCKLTDFGSSRKLNMLMTNMTFTKDIGTPKYIALEVLDRKNII